MFKTVVDRVGLGSTVPLEFFGTRTLVFLPNGNSLHTFEVGVHVMIIKLFTVNISTRVHTCSCLNQSLCCLFSKG